MKAAERREMLLQVMDGGKCRWSTVAYLAREVRGRTSQVAIDLRKLAADGHVTIMKVNHVLEGMGRRRAVSILVARRPMK